MVSAELGFSSSAGRIRSQAPELVLLLGLFVVGVASRIPFRSEVLYHWDSVNFALALDHFDLRLHQPQPPGYFYYVMLGRGLRSVVADSNAALVWLSVLFSGLGAAATYLLGGGLFGRRVGIAAAALFLSSPLMWLYGIVGLTYIAEASIAALVAWLCVRLAHRAGTPVLYSATLAIGLAGGIRPNTMVFLLPMWLYAVVRARPSAGHALAAASLLALLGASWLVPTILLSGGLEGSLEAFGSTSRWAVEQSVVADPSHVVLNGLRLAVAAFYGLMAATAPLLVASLVVWREGSLRSLGTKGWVLLLWLIPSIVFYTLVLIRQPGHISTCFAALLVLASAGLSRLTERTRSRQVFWAILGVLVAANTAFFMFGPASFFGRSDSVFAPPTRSAVLEQVRLVRDSVEAIRGHFSPDTTAVLAGNRNFRYPDFYLRDFQYPGLSYALDRGLVVLDPRVSTLVLFDQALAERVTDRSKLRSLRLGSGGALLYLERADGDGPFEVSTTAIRTRPNLGGF